MDDNKLIVLYTLLGLTLVMILSLPFVSTSSLLKSTRIERATVNELIFNQYDDRIITNIKDGNSRNNYDKMIEFSDGVVVYVNIDCDDGCVLEEL